MLVDRRTRLDQADIQNESDAEMNVSSQRLTWTLAVPQEPSRTHTSPLDHARIQIHSYEHTWSHMSHANSHGLTRTLADSRAEC